MSLKGWIAVDLDGTLAEYDGWKGPFHIGKPIPKMVERVRRWLEDGFDVKIFTARMSSDEGPLIAPEGTVEAIQKWLVEEAGLPALEVTNVKDLAMLELWDDRAVQVVENTGEPVGKSRRGL